MPSPLRPGEKRVTQPRCIEASLGEEHLLRDASKDRIGELISCHQVRHRSVHPELHANLSLSDLRLAHEEQAFEVLHERLDLQRESKVRIWVTPPLLSVKKPK